MRTTDAWRSITMRSTFVSSVTRRTFAPPDPMTRPRSSGSTVNSQRRPDSISACTRDTSSARRSFRPKRRCSCICCPTSVSSSSCAVSTSSLLPAVTTSASPSRLTDATGRDSYTRAATSSARLRCSSRGTTSEPRHVPGSRAGSDAEPDGWLGAGAAGWRGALRCDAPGASTAAEVSPPPRPRPPPPGTVLCCLGARASLRSAAAPCVDVGRGWGTGTAAGAAVSTPWPRPPRPPPRPAAPGAPPPGTIGLGSALGSALPPCWPAGASAQAAAAWAGRAGDTGGGGAVWTPPASGRRFRGGRCGLAASLEAMCQAGCVWQRPLGGPSCTVRRDVSLASSRGPPSRAMSAPRGGGRDKGEKGDGAKESAAVVSKTGLFAKDCACGATQASKSDAQRSEGAPGGTHPVPRAGRSAAPWSARTRLPLSLSDSFPPFLWQCPA
jgi:hypothetical protein